MIWSNEVNIAFHVFVHSLGYGFRFLNLVVSSLWVILCNVMMMIFCHFRCIEDLSYPTCFVGENPVRC